MGSKNCFILTGDPGVGKTTLIKKIVKYFVEKGVSLTGFYTEELRENNSRIGFDIVSLDGSNRGVLARHFNNDGSCKAKVGKYFVMLEKFENVAMPLLNISNSKTNSIIVIDEIGKMELLSERFKTEVIKLFSNMGTNLILATVPLKSKDKTVYAIKNNKTTQIYMVTRTNREFLLDDIVRDMEMFLKKCNNMIH